MKEIPLTKGKTALVDDEDYEYLSQWKWCVSGEYAVATINSKQMFMHRILLNAPKGLVVDHIDMNCLNNQRDNIRLCTRAQNAANCKSRPHRKNKSEKASPYKGVHWKRQTGRWGANISANGKTKGLGYYDTEKDAAMAYNVAAKEMFGEFARLNDLGC